MLAVWSVASMVLGVVLTVAGRRMVERATAAPSWSLMQVVALPISTLIGIGVVMLFVFCLDGRWRDFGMAETALSGMTVASGAIAIRLMRRHRPQGASPDRRMTVSAFDDEDERRRAA